MEAITPVVTSLPALVRVKTEKGIETFAIREQSPTHIVAVNAAYPEQQLVLEYTNNGWRVQGDNDNHYPVEVIPEVDLTGQPIIDINILKYLGFDLLEYLCLRVPYIQSICKQDQLWRSKIELEYPTFPDVPGVTSYYIYSRLSREGMLGLVRWAVKRRIYPILKWVTEAFVANPEESGELLFGVQIVVSIPGSSLTHSLSVRLADLLAEAGYLDLMQLINVYPTHDGIMAAVVGGHLDVLKWIVEKRIPLPGDQDISETAAQHGRLEILKWLKERGVVFSRRVVGAAAASGHLKVLEWMESVGYPMDVEAANNAAGGGHDSLLDWFEERGVFPNNGGAELAAAEGHLSTLERLDEQGIHIAEEDVQETVNIVAEGGHVDVMKWILERYEVDWSEASNSVINGDNLVIFELMIGGEKGLQNIEVADAVATIDTALRSGSLNIATWLWEHGVVPGQGAIIDSLRQGGYGVAKWLAVRHVPVTPDPTVMTLSFFKNIAVKAAQEGNIVVLEWLSGFGSYYYPEAIEAATRNNKMGALGFLESMRR